MTFGSRAPYAKVRNERQMKENMHRSDHFPDTGPSSAAWMHKKLELIKLGQEGDLGRMHRLARENLTEARLNEEKQISQLSTGRRAGLIGEGARVRAAQQAAEQIYNGI